MSEKLENSGEKKEENLETKIIKTFEIASIDDYVRYLKSPWRILWSNLLAGIARGIGFILGVTVVLGAVVWFVAQMVDVPLIGEYFQTIEKSINEYKESTNYKQEFQSMEKLLEEINTSLQN